MEDQRTAESEDDESAEHDPSVLERVLDFVVTYVP
jgi:hypothetical protein